MDDLLMNQNEEMVFPDLQTLLSDECDMKSFDAMIADVDAVQTQRGKQLILSADEKLIETEALGTPDTSNEIAVGQMEGSIEMNQQNHKNNEPTNESIIVSGTTAPPFQMLINSESGIESLEPLVADVSADETQRVQHLEGSDEDKLIEAEVLKKHDSSNGIEISEEDGYIKLHQKSHSNDEPTNNCPFATSEHMKQLQECIASQNAQMDLYQATLMSFQSQLVEKDELISQLEQRNKVEFESQISEAKNKNVALQTRVETLESDNMRLTKQFQKCCEDLENTNIRYENLKAEYEQALRYEQNNNHSSEDDDAVIVSYDNSTVSRGLWDLHIYRGVDEFSH